MDCNSAEACSEDVRQENEQFLRGDEATRTPSQTRRRWCLGTAMLAGAIILIQALAFRMNAAKAITTWAKPENSVTLSIATPAEVENAVTFGKLSYADVKATCLKTKELFEDPEFPVFFSKGRPLIWKRPKEIVSNPKFFAGGASRFDVLQGFLGDSWLLAAIAGLTQYNGLFDQVVPPDQSFEDDYCGAFRFRFWQYGKWVEVTVDDRLPTYNNKLMYAHSREKNEFWSALLEKAYAKLSGSYQSLKGGRAAEAMEDFTGGVTETFILQRRPAGLFKLMMKAVRRHSLMGTSIEEKPNEIEAKLDNGLAKGHAYTITGVYEVRLNGKDVQLIRCRTPRGKSAEWNGAWSDGSSEWNELSAAQKTDLGYTFDDDGEFFMSFDDYVVGFTRLEVCMLGPDDASSIDKKNWEMTLHDGSWKKGVTAGGCRNFPDTFPMNPQYRITLKDPDDDDDVDLATLVVGVIQKDRRKLGRYLTIGFAIYKLEDDASQYMENGHLTKAFFLYHESIARSPSFANSREVTGRFSFKPGEYVIIPSTFRAGEEGDFICRLYCERPKEYTTQTEITLPEYSSKTQTEISLITLPEYSSETSALDKKLKRVADQIAGKDAEIDAFELRLTLSSAFKKKLAGKSFSLEASRTLVASEDLDRNGKLDYSEFRDAWRNMMEWSGAFSGSMTATELQEALAKLGFKLSTPILESLAFRYADEYGRISFDDFVVICCRIKSAYGSYLSYHGKSFSLDDYLLSTLYS